MPRSHPSRTHPGPSFNLDKMSVGPSTQRRPAKSVLHSLSPVVVYRAHRTGCGATEGINGFRDTFSCIGVCTVFLHCLVSFTLTTYIFVHRLFPSLRKLYLHWKPRSSFIGPAIICCSLVGEVRNIIPQWKCRQVNLATVFFSRDIIDLEMSSCASPATMTGHITELPTEEFQVLYFFNPIRAQINFRFILSMHQH